MRNFAMVGAGVAIGCSLMTAVFLLAAAKPAKADEVLKNVEDDGFIKVVHLLPTEPGVYKFYDEQEQVVCYFTVASAHGTKAIECMVDSHYQSPDFIHGQ